MVKLNMNILMKSTSGRVIRKPDESHEQYLMKVTHLYLENKQLDSISREIGLCKNLTVLYLYDNNLTEMPNLSACQALTHVYVQNNNISKIDHLQYLSNLTKLYIGHNKINFVEGLHMNTMLQELYIEYQELYPGEKLLFDPRTISAISTSLEIINISGNKLDNLEQMKQLKNLKQLLATDNKVEDINKTLSILSGFNCLHRLELQQNPICSHKKYRDLIIMEVSSLESLDGKEITDTSRQFLLKWRANKDAIDKKKEENKTKDVPVYLTANEMRFSSSNSQNRNFGPSKYSGKEIMRVKIS